MHPWDEITVQQLRAAGGLKWSMFPEAIGAFVAEADFGTDPLITAALHEAVDAAAFGYLPAATARAMAEATATWQREEYGWEVDPERIHPIADVVTGLELAMVHFSSPGAAVILPTPAYMPFLDVPVAAGRRIIQVPLRAESSAAGGADADGADAARAQPYAFDLDGLDAAFRDAAAREGGALLVLCNPYNPVGRVFTRQELVAVSEVVERHGGRVFADEIHAPLVFGGHRHVPYASVSAVAAAHTVTATSASKAWNLPGLKCAQFILSNATDVASWHPIEHAATHGASTLGVIANTVAYRDGRPWLAGQLDYLDDNRRLLAELVAEHLPGARYRMPEGTYIAWLDCRALDLPGGPAAFFRRRAGVALTDGRACGAPGIGHARLVFATPRPILRAAVEAMGAALATR